MSSKSKVFRSAAVLFVMALIAGCPNSQIQPVPKMAAPPPIFPPQTAMQTGDYAGFFKENSEVLKTCNDPDKCAEALFNLSFLHFYSKSPYYNPRKGLKYLEDLTGASPGSPWTFQAKVWKDLIEKNMQRKAKKRSAHEEAKAKEAPESQELPEEVGKPAEPSPEKYWETDRQRLEDEIRSKDTTIKELNRQLQRSRQIDIEMEKKERGLLK